MVDLIVGGGEPIMRQARRDKGSVQLTPRDIAGLSWIGEQYAIRCDQLARLLGRIPSQHGYQEKPVSPRTVHGVVERWKRIGYAETGKFLYREPYWIWLTGAGLSFVDLPYHPWKAGVQMLAHVYATNQVRLFVEQKRGTGIIWRSERQLRQLYGRDAPHLPDAEVAVEGVTVAVEVELTQKAHSRLKETLMHLAEAYRLTWYYTTPATEAAVNKALTELVREHGEGIAAKFKVYPLTGL